MDQSMAGPLESLCFPASAQFFPCFKIFLKFLDTSKCFFRGFKWIVISLASLLAPTTLRYMDLSNCRSQGDYVLTNSNSLETWVVSTVSVVKYACHLCCGLWIHLLKERLKVDTFCLPEFDFSHRTRGLAIGDFICTVLTENFIRL